MFQSLKPREFLTKKQKSKLTKISLNTKPYGSTPSIDQVSLVLLEEVSVEVCSHPLVIVQHTWRDGQVMACNVMLQSDASWGKMINLSVAIVRNIVIQSQRCGDII